MLFKLSGIAIWYFILLNSCRFWWKWNWSWRLWRVSISSLIFVFANSCMYVTCMCNFCRLHASFFLFDWEIFNIVRDLLQLAVYVLVTLFLIINFSFEACISVTLLHTNRIYVSILFFKSNQIFYGEPSILQYRCWLHLFCIIEFYGLFLCSKFELRWTSFLWTLHNDALQYFW